MSEEQVYDTLTQPIGSENTGLQSGGSLGFSFNSDDVSSGLLTDVKVSLSDATPTDGGEVLARLYATDDSVGLPIPTTQIANLGVISDAQLSLSTAPSDIPVATPIALAPGTQYMVVLTGILGSEATFGFESGATGIGSHDESFYTHNGAIGGADGETQSDSIFNTAPTAQVTENVTCFASGTRLGTAHGDIDVETLQVGDLVFTAAGGLRPIAWMGHRTVDCCRHPRRAEVMPIRICAHAFGASGPHATFTCPPATPSSWAQMRTERAAISCRSCA